MDASHAVALDRAISPDRLGTYLGAANGDVGLARELYVWDRDVASALLADIAIAEVALRNALNLRLSADYGPDWYRTRDLFDQRSVRALASAWSRLPRAGRTPGRLVAQLTLGFWVGLLDAGAEMGPAPQDYRANYEDLWRRTLSRGFPGGRVAAAAAGRVFNRAWVHSVALEIQGVRNRAAHHEPLLRGIPLNGQKDSTGRARRITVQQGHDQLRTLIGMVDRDLLAWLDGNTQVPTVLLLRP
ncbi:MAG TPA: hypothetical protein DHV14_07705 [Micrococcales bacterium]|uniref:hypothetical protein n=1 Tax=Miniimonas arenae TaxID=676201 RepID=UPI000EEA3022|nr:hypothetical protein [Miniimonas arenae]HCX85003.1 hypothetical protein [Micrococcales bacterium]